MTREPNTQYVLSLSYGKDSLACLEAIRILGLPLDRIIHAEVWATDTIHADLPPMVAFKAKADKIIKERYGIEVEHLCAERDGRKITYESVFYSVPNHRQSTLERIAANRERERERDIDWVIKGFPLTRGSWCKKLKIDYLRFSDTERDMVQYAPENEDSRFDKTEFLPRPSEQGAITNTVQYLGIAADEPIRIERHTRPGVVLPLVLAGWDEAFCRQLCKELDLLSPIYTDSARGGCWFCHNQGVEQLRLLRRNYPDLWALLLKWDNDSPVTFHSDGHTVHHFDLRFQAEDEGRVPTDRKFRWKMLNL